MGGSAVGQLPSHESAAADEIPLLPYSFILLNLGSSEAAFAISENNFESDCSFWSYPHHNRSVKAISHYSDWIGRFGGVAGLARPSWSGRDLLSPRRLGSAHRDNGHELYAAREGVQVSLVRT